MYHIFFKSCTLFENPSRFETLIMDFICNGMNISWIRILNIFFKNFIDCIVSKFYLNSNHKILSIIVDNNFCKERKYDLIAGNKANIRLIMEKVIKIVFYHEKVLAYNHCWQMHKNSWGIPLESCILKNVGEFYKQRLQYQKEVN